MIKIEINKGDIINGITFIKELTSNGYNPKERISLFKCHCGKIFKNKFLRIYHGQIKSCGCLTFNTVNEFPIGAIQIENYIDYYATKDGNIYSLKNNIIKILKKIQNKNNYQFVNLRKNNKAKFKSVHRIIAETFIPNPNNLPQVNHINGIKTDNRVENLEWVTARENLHHIRLNMKNKPIGISFKKCINKWVSIITVNKKNTYIGAFNTQEEAHQAYINKSKELGIINKYLI